MRKNNQIKKIFFISILTFFTITLSLATDYWLKVKKVIDGDTIVLETGKTVRLIGVDTPETVHPNKPVEYFGKQASKFTKKMLLGKRVRLEFDQQKVDKYGRILAYIFLEDSTFFNAELIKQGYAHAYTKYPFRQDYMDLFRKLENEARLKAKGLWADTNIPTTQTTDDLKGKFVGSKNSNKFHHPDCRWAKKIKPENLVIFDSIEQAMDLGREPCKVCKPLSSELGKDSKISTTKKGSQDIGDTIVYVTKTGKKYHRAGCRYLRRSKIPIKLKDAVKRYSPCSVCNPPTVKNN